MRFMDGDAGSVGTAPVYHKEELFVPEPAVLPAEEYRDPVGRRQLDDLAVASWRVSTGYLMRPYPPGRPDEYI